jgi:hypothetical protein
MSLLPAKAFGLELVTDIAKTLVLSLCRAKIRSRRIGKMGHEPPELRMSRARYGLRKFTRLRSTGCAEPREATIDLEV